MFLLRLALCCLSVSSLLAQGSFRCGKERWNIKTGTDTGANAIDLASAQPTSIAHLVSLSAPSPIPQDTRVGPAETRLWQLSATLTAFKIEDDPKTGDWDYHLVIMDPAGITMIAEIPFPSCVGAGSPFTGGITDARKSFDGKFTPSGSFQEISVPVTITGVGMFDFAHGQRGRSDNGIEIHPVLSISFDGTGTTPPVSGGDPSGAPGTQLIGNPGFESGSNAVPWQASAGVIDNSNTEPAHTGKWKAWLGGTGKKHTDTMSQKVTIPSGASHATLSFWLRIDTDETTSQQRDTLQVEVVGPSGTASLAQYSNADASTFHRRKFDLDDFIGQTVTIRFVAAEDGRNPTSFVVDDVNLTVQ
jgi:hypothetical protein